MKTAVEWLENELIVVRLDVDKSVLKFIDKSIKQAKEIEKEQKGYSEEEVLEFTQTIIQQYKLGNTNIEQLDSLKETLELFKKK